MQQEQQKKTVRHPLRPFERVVIKNQCPECSSVFVTKRECESCGLQFWVDFLGEPFGERSFFSMESDLGNEKGHSLYLKALERRFVVLTDYFFQSFDEDRQRRKMFLFEANSLIKDFILEGGQAEWAWKKISSFEKHPFFPKLALTIKESCKELENSDNLNLKGWKKFKEYRILNTFKLFFLINFLFLSFMIIAAALLYYRYLIA